MMKNLICTSMLKPLLGFCAIILLSLPLKADMTIVSEDANLQQGYSSEELKAFTGNWQLEHSDVVLLIKDVSADGKSDVNIIANGDMTVKRVIVSRFVGSIPLLTIETQRLGEFHGTFCLMREGDKLVGTFDDAVTGRSVGVTLTHKKQIQVSLN